jgi:hypothetical protein
MMTAKCSMIEFRDSVVALVSCGVIVEVMIRRKSFR